MNQFEIRFKDRNCERTVLDYDRSIEYDDPYDSYELSYLHNKMQNLKEELEICADPDEISLVINNRIIRYKKV